MPTFILKKYDQENNSTKYTKDVNEISKKEEVPEELTIQVTGTISEIVANALQKVLANDIKIEEVSDSKETESNIKVISTEDINSNPLNTFSSIKKDNIVFIYNKGFKTVAEEWLLTNISNKTSNVFFTMESFIKFIKTKINVI